MRELKSDLHYDRSPVDCARLALTWPTEADLLEWIDSVHQLRSQRLTYAKARKFLGETFKDIISNSPTGINGLPVVDCLHSHTTFAIHSPVRTRPPLLHANLHSFISKFSHPPPFRFDANGRIMLAIRAYPSRSGTCSCDYQRTCSTFRTDIPHPSHIRYEQQEEGCPIYSSRADSRRMVCGVFLGFEAKRRQLYAWLSFVAMNLFLSFLSEYNVSFPRWRNRMEPIRSNSYLVN